MDNPKTTVEDILAGHSEQVVELVLALRELVRQTVPELAEEPKRGWGNISYKKQGLVCAISPQKTYATLYFYKGTRLTDPQGLLEGSGKALRHLKIRKLDDIHEDQIAAWLNEALSLEEG